jgi:PAS domain-containing protein
MPIFICPNCGNRTESSERTAGFQSRAKGCKKCGFGFLFELLDDYYPAPGTGFIVCDQNRRILALGQGVFELTGFREKDVLGLDVTEAFSLEADSDANPADITLEWGVRQLGKSVSIRTRSGVTKVVRADFFPAYDEDGGLLMALVPS